jgi:hypothetical protein
MVLMEHEKDGDIGSRNGEKMGIGTYSKGWGDPDEYDSYDSDYDSSDSGNKITENERLYRFRFSIPTPKGTDKKPNLVNPGSSATKRVLFLDGSPFNIYEHSLWRFKNAYNIFKAFTAICLEKNGISKIPCPVCSKKGGKDFAYFIGFLPVIDMGQVERIGNRVRLHHEYWENDNGDRFERSFQRVLLGAKRGSVDNPGVMKTLQRRLAEIRQQHGIEDLTGTIWDTTRTGKKEPIVGNEWSFVDKILPEHFEEYLVRWGADPEYLKLDIPVYTDPDSKKGVFDIDVDDYQAKLDELVGWGDNRGNKSVHDGQRQGMVRSNMQTGMREPPKTYGVGFGDRVNTNGFNNSGQYVGPNGPNDDDIPF